ncbi:MAG: type II toxin-antitoxin system VapC family toxin [Euzebya sp.]
MGLIHLDAGVIIAFLDRDDSHHDAARATLSNALDCSDRLSIAASALAECLVGPARHDPKAMELVRTVVDRLPVSVVELNAEVATQAAVLRAGHRSLKLPDALVIATAATSGAGHLITTDRKWPTAKAMKLTVIIEQI